MASKTKMMCLRSNESDLYFVDPSWFAKSVKVQNVLEVYGTDICNCIIPLDIKSFVLEKLIEWLKHYKDIEKVEYVSEWDKLFQRSLRNDVDNMYKAADILNIANLRDMLDLGTYRLCADSSSDDDSDYSDYFNPKVSA